MRSCAGALEVRPRSSRPAARRQTRCSPGPAGAVLVGTGARAEEGRVTEEMHMHGWRVVFQGPNYSNLAGELEVE